MTSIRSIRLARLSRRSLGEGGRRFSEGGSLGESGNLGAIGSNLEGGGSRGGRLVLDLGLLLTTLAILYFELPKDLQSHTHWDKVAWIPFAARPMLPRDIALNILAYVPFGALARLRLPRRPWLCLSFALALSLAGEGAQVFSHGRVPSMTDVLCNVIGAGAGIAMVRRFRPSVDR